MKIVTKIFHFDNGSSTWVAALDNLQAIQYYLVEMDGDSDKEGFTFKELNDEERNEVKFDNLECPAGEKYHGVEFVSLNQLLDMGTTEALPVAIAWEN